MKKIALLMFLVALGAAPLHAGDQVAAVQQELKDQGFYYGQVDGQPGPETTAAIRRYQIRNGLQVDGTLNKETLTSLKIAGSAGAAPAPAAKNAPLPPPPAPLDAQPQPQQPQTPPAQQDVNQSDREFLAKQNAPVNAPPPAATNENSNPNVVPPPVAVEPPQPPPLNIQLSALFVRTPYQNAPLVVQQATLRNAQINLARRTYYNGAIDGIPGPATAQAILAFQANGGLAQTGRLDIETLAALRLLPNQGPPPPAQPRVIIQPFYPPPVYVQPRVYRGRWGD